MIIDRSQKHFLLIHTYIMLFTKRRATFFCIPPFLCSSYTYKNIRIKDQESRHTALNRVEEDNDLIF